MALLATGRVRDCSAIMSDTEAEVELYITAPDVATSPMYDVPRPPSKRENAQQNSLRTIT